jgi:hypothetical protein
MSGAERREGQEGKIPESLAESFAVLTSDMGAAPAAGAAVYGLKLAAAAAACTADAITVGAGVGVSAGADILRCRSRGKTGREHGDETHERPGVRQHDRGEGSGRGRRLS